jgi:hypothetical protein
VSGGSATAQAGALDRHEGIRDPRAGGCPRWPELLRLLSSQGELVVGRCKCTNLCRYCQLLFVLETVEMLLLDAAEHAPTLYVVLTAREHLTRKACTDHLRQLRRAAKRIWPDVEWFVQVEFQRRGALHLNLLVKGVPVDQAPALLSVLSDRWCARVDAEPVGQWVGEISDAGGLSKYLAKHLGHGLKAEQAPPIGWRGHRTSQTGGYLVRPASVMRQEARRSRRLHRALDRAIKAGHHGHDAELVAQQTVAIEDETTWQLRNLAPPRQPMTDRERDGRELHIPAHQLEAAFRWQDAGSDVVRVAAALDLPVCEVDP